MPEVYQIVVKGTVQGVFFRAKTKTHADRLGLSGNVKNLNDGSVEIIVAGEKHKLEELIAALYAEPLPVEVESITMKKIPSSETYTSFEINQT